MTETIIEEGQLLGFIDSAFKSTGLNILKKLNETIGRELKEIRKKMYELSIKRLSIKRKMYVKDPNSSSGVKSKITKIRILRMF